MLYIGKADFHVMLQIITITLTHKITITFWGSVKDKSWIVNDVILYMNTDILFL